MEKKYKLSVIIPIYNVEKYLKKCKLYTKKENIDCK